MKRGIYRITIITLLAGEISLAFQTRLQAAHHQHGQHGQKAKKHDHSTHHHDDICAGFVVLSNGYAVLSAMESGHHGMKHGMSHGSGHDQTGHHAMAKKEGMAHKGHMKKAMAKNADHLMGHKHGDDIPTSKGVTCVPIGDVASTSWSSVSASANLKVKVVSLKGALAHNSRANESLSLHVTLDGKPVEQGTVSLIARMPHHDHRMAGGHGPANDPDVKGLETMPEGNGSYRARMVDFSMGGAWLFEVQVQADGQLHKAYFASEIGEE